MKYIILAGLSFIMMGCSQKKPIELKNNHTFLVNKKIFDKHHNLVPLDKSFKKQRYSYIINTSKKGNTFFDNNILVKAFYLLHHADLIVITGNDKIVREYMHYLSSNGVTAPTEANDVNINTNKVMIDTVHYSPISKTQKNFTKEVVYD